MKTTVEFLDSVKARHGFTSDYQLSAYLGCSRQAISKYRVGKDFLGDEMACKVAEDLGIDAGYVLASIASERTNKPGSCSKPSSSPGQAGSSASRAPLHNSGGKP